MSVYRISQLTERTGVPATTLRFYEQQGLLPAQRSAAGYRLYDDAAVDRLGFIGAGKHLGLPLEEIRELLGVWESGLCVQVQDRLRPLLRAGIESAERRAGELAVFTERLQRALIRLDGPAREGRCDPSCDFLLRDEPSPAGAVAPDADALVEPPVACSLSAGAREAQLGRWRRLMASGEAPTSVDGGLRVALPIELLGEAAALSAAEQQCCPFFDFRLVLAGARVHLEVRAPADAVGLVHDLLAGQGR